MTDSYVSYGSSAYSSSAASSASSSYSSSASATASGDIYEWTRGGVLHRDEVDDNGMYLPAKVYPSGKCEWWYNGLRHRDGDLPAVTFPDGHAEWWINGGRHREGDRPAVVSAAGTKEWFEHGNRRAYNGNRNNFAVQYANGLRDYYDSRGKYLFEEF